MTTITPVRSRPIRTLAPTRSGPTLRRRRRVISARTRWAYRILGAVLACALLEITGRRGTATSKVRCIDVAALVTAALQTACGDTHSEKQCRSGMPLSSRIHNVPAGDYFVVTRALPDLLKPTCETDAEQPASSPSTASSAAPSTAASTAS